jgi:hypothetical protein
LNKKQEIRVRADGLNGDWAQRALAILDERVRERSPSRVRAVERDEDVRLCLAQDLPPEAYRIEAVGETMRVAGGDWRGLLYGLGKFLRTSGYEGGFAPSTWRGSSAPQGWLRGMYFASHFHNWYHEASDGEIARYVDDLALWGVNAVMAAFPFIDLSGWDDPQAEAAVAMARRTARIVRGAGLQFGLGAGNTFFSGAPRELRALALPDPTGRRGNSGNPICPSKPAGRAYILENTRQLFERLQDVGLDFLVHWPYDEGGCACEDCKPWGSNGFLRLSHDLTELGREFFPGLKAVLSTWMFDTPPEGEWQGLSEALSAGGGWVEAILADAHEDYPRYPLDVEVPGGLPLLNFPEISMWGNWPWGGVGANPLPGRLQRLWDQVRHKVRGGFPYSEGIYEDMNKVVTVQFYWDGDQTVRETLAEYCAYEYGTQSAADALELVDLLERAASNQYQKLPVDAEAVRRAWRLAENIHSRLPGWAQRSWRWEIVRLRALLDRERFAGGGLGTDVAEAAMLRLAELYHCQLETDDPYHHRVRPPLRGAVSRGGEW